LDPVDSSGQSNSGKLHWNNLSVESINLEDEAVFRSPDKFGSTENSTEQSSYEEVLSLHNPKNIQENSDRVSRTVLRLPDKFGSYLTNSLKRALVLASML